MTIEEVINQLRGLAEDRKSFFHNDNDPLREDEIFREDHEALTIAVKLIVTLSKAANDYKTIIGERMYKKDEKRNKLSRRI
ncbi:MAG: hypothetical protein LBI42_12790 [Chitinispirillales bacterium]|jgi:hypothetical protein|nr:hypothetical protein [Chitinispirillales bacterium]